MTVLAYNDPDIGTRCIRCAERTYGVTLPDGTFSMPDSIRTPEGWNVYPMDEDGQWWDSESYQTTLYCDDCGSFIAESPINDDYCSCGDGCLADDCGSCEDRDTSYDRESGCRCAGCKAMAEWVPGDPPPYVAPEEEAAPTTTELYDALVAALSPEPHVDRFYDPSFAPGVEYTPAPGYEWEESRVYDECQSRSVRPIAEGGFGWYCERVLGHPLPHGAFLVPERGPLGTRCWN